MSNAMTKGIIRACLIPSLLGMFLMAQEPRPERPTPIQDNSFLVEEAYNQEEGVVQHINTFTRFRQSQDWIYTFTQEWPFPLESAPAKASARSSST